MLTRVLSAVGRTCIGSGLLLLLFVAYQLWGTGLHEARAQDDLDRQFRDRLAAATADVSKTASTVVDKDAPGATTTSAAPTTTVAPPSTSTVPTSTTEPGNRPDRVAPVAVEEGQALARIRIPAIGVDKLVVSGVSVEDLRKGPGHYRSTPQPGYAGNTAIAGHRTTYGAPFGDIDKLVPGDDIEITTVHGTWHYLVMGAPDDPTSGHFIVAPEDTWVLKDFGDNRLTLSACHPKFSASQRIIVTARLVEAPDAPPLPVATAGAGGGTVGDAGTEPDPATVDAAPTANVDDPSLDEGLGGDPSARTPALLWALVFLVLLAGIWQLSIGWRRWPAYLVGAVPMIITLFAWFEQLDRWMPAR